MKKGFIVHGILFVCIALLILLSLFIYLFICLYILYSWFIFLYTVFTKAKTTNFKEYDNNENNNNKN